MERGAAVKQQPDLMGTMGRQTGPLVKETHNQAGEEEGRGLQGSGLRAMGRLGWQGQVGLGPGTEPEEGGGTGTDLSSEAESTFL